MKLNNSYLHIQIQDFSAREEKVDVISMIITKKNIFVDVRNLLNSESVEAQLQY